MLDQLYPDPLEGEGGPIVVHISYTQTLYRGKEGCVRLAIPRPSTGGRRVVLDQLYPDPLQGEGGLC